MIKTQQLLIACATVICLVALLEAWGVTHSLVELAPNVVEKQDITVHASFSRHSACHSFYGNDDSKDRYPSVSSVWNRLRQPIIDASISPEQMDSGTVPPQFLDWVQELYDFHSPKRLRKTRTHSADPQSIEALLSIIQTRRNGLNQDGTNTTAPPLHILVVGGSVTMGVSCPRNHINASLSKTRSCSWPNRLEHLMNRVLFDNMPVVKITNMGSGGTSSWMGALVMEYQLFPDRNSIPHVIVSSYAPNDYQQQNKYAQFGCLPCVHNQYVKDSMFASAIDNFLMLAKNVRPCEEHLPLVVLADHAYGDVKNSSTVTTSQLLTGKYSVLAQWYDILGFNQQNIARHELYANFDNKTAVEPLVGSGFAVHMGTGFHMSMAWTALFNLLESFVDTCNDLSARILPQDNNAIPPYPSSGRIENHLQATTPSVKQLSNMNLGTNAEIVQAWNQRVVENEEKCASIQANKKHSDASNNKPDIVCPHVWIVGEATGITTAPQLKRFLRPFLTTSHKNKHKDGWMVDGSPDKNPRTGFYGSIPKSFFEMKIPLDAAPAKFLTILSMRSYGGIWKDSLLRLDVAIERNTPLLDTTGAKDMPLLPETNATAIYHDHDKATFEISGYQEEQTSVHYPFKFELPGHGAAEGDVLTIKGTLQEGKMFKIHGIIICRF